MPIIASYLCQLMIVAMLGYGLNIGCLFTSDACDQVSACCVNCNFPAQLDKVDHTVHIKHGPALLPTEILSLTAIVITLGEIEPYAAAESPPRMVPTDQTDPVRGPPVA